MQKDFQLSLTKTLRYEGGYVNDKDDAGGETYKGISRKNFHNWSGWKLIDLMKVNKNFPKCLDQSNGITQAVSDFYYDEFWSKIAANKLLNSKVCSDIFDTAVNNGTVTAIKLVQGALEIEQTGKMDEKTVDKLNTIVG